MADEPERGPGSDDDPERGAGDAGGDDSDSSGSGERDDATGSRSPGDGGDDGGDSGDAPVDAGSADDAGDDSLEADDAGGDEPETGADESDGADEPETGADEPETGADEPETGADESDGADESRTGDDESDGDDAGSGPGEEDGSRDGDPDESDAGGFSQGAERDSHDRSDRDAGQSDADPGPPDHDAGEQSGDDRSPGGVEPPSAEREMDDAPGGVPDDATVPPGERPSPPEDVAPGERPSAVDSDGGAVNVDHPDNMAEATPVERKTGPASDEEMPLADHVEEMVTRLFAIVAVAGVVSVAVFPFGEEIIHILWYQVLPGSDVAQPRVYHPLALLLTQLKVASLAGLIVALPVFVYQTYAFMRPGLYPHERRYYLAAVPMSLVLALVGVTFAYYVVLPAIFQYFLYYSRGVTTIAFALSDTFSLILLLMGYLALVFQIPLFIMLAIMMGLTTRRWLQDRRLYFWGGFLGVAFLFSPDPTGMAPILVAATMIVLFEGTLLLLQWTGR